MLASAVPFANPNPVLARGGAMLALAVSATVVGACAGSTDVTSGTGGAGGSSSSNLDAGHDGVWVPLSCDNAMTATTMTANNMAMCAGKGNWLNRGVLPATGVLIDKINQPPGVCGNPMPFAAPKLAQVDLDCLQAWANGLVNSVGP
jgi:hypothetical protein